MIRKARPEDTDAIWEFLAPRRATSMFLSGNLTDHGINTEGQPKSNTVWVGIKKGRVKAVFGLTEYGYLVFEAGAFQANWTHTLREQMAGRKIRGMNGTWDQFTAVRDALGLGGTSGPFDVRQPHYHLRLEDLTVPAGDSELRDIRSIDLPLLRDWRFAANVEVMSVPETGESRAMAVRYADELLETDRGRLLWAGDTPVAMTAFNAETESCVQVGSVYTPPDQRRKGYARRAVALHLHQVRPKGVEEAILFAASQNAARAYEAIGFCQIGDYGVVDFSEPQIVATHAEVLT
ncbi:Acetyltransferase (GNAT) family protein [Shimia gijangensis]|uniref:Acetyltransferase (GNAT) family protein n=1 Tax=Shimia gijangensis TaxID=1470563 RepID=A0A1M6FBH8_9RHOB|nr:GNAT family N-acetyltransferase [Shimia gijangensis]SHI94959.1 Acetyltransferase (GNAT) family protein [Shimia gijangensis]